MRNLIDIVRELLGIKPVDEEISDTQDDITLVDIIEKGRLRKKPEIEE